MNQGEEYLRRAEAAEAEAAALPEGFERNELLRRAAALRHIADLHLEQERKRSPDQP